MDEQSTMRHRSVKSEGGLHACHLKNRDFNPFKLTNMLKIIMHSVP